MGDGVRRTHVPGTDAAKKVNEGDGNVMSRNLKKMEVVKWRTLSPAVQVKLLFLLDIGDKTSDNYSDDSRSTAAEVARDAFMSVLQDRQHSFFCVTEVLAGRTEHLREYPLVTLKAGTPAADHSVRKDDEDLLTFVHACRHLHVDYDYLNDKIIKVQEKLSLTKEEMEGNTLIYTENLRMLHLCDALTAHQVGQLLALIVEDKTLGEFVAEGLDVPPDKLKDTKGLKEALFFYLIRTLELEDKLNRIYTGKLEALLKQLQDQTEDEAEKRVLSEAITGLSDYPSGGRPAGHCVVFCVTKDRDGAKEEIRKVKRVFGSLLGYTVHVEEYPGQENLKKCLSELQKPKYKYYDSIVYWFMCHGLNTSLELADGSSMERKTIIEKFSKVNSFRKKPKIFFMASCQGESSIHLKEKRGVIVEADSANLSPTAAKYSEVPERSQNITAVYYQMDRLVACATLPEQYAYRRPGEGSVYVDIVCRLIEQYRGHNITHILERVTNFLHQILFDNKKSFGYVKQACYYESTFQKTFRVP